MPIYKMTKDSIEPITPVRFAELNLTERGDLQRLLRDRIEIIAKDVLVIAEEFCDWSDSRRRIDLLGVDREANVVVIELKRTEDGGHMELQAVRYAAMVSAITFEQAALAFAKYLTDRGDQRDPVQTLLDFLGWDEPQEDIFGQSVRIVLASAEFSKELTTTALWLREQSVDISCVRLQPCGTSDNTLLDVQQVVPLPEAEDYQVRVQKRTAKRRESRESSRDFTRYDITIGSRVIENQPKRRAILHVVKGLVDSGVEPEQLAKLVTWKYLFFQAEGSFTGDQIAEQIAQRNSKGNVRRWFVEDDEIIQHGTSTYCISNQWGRRTEEALKAFIETSDSHEISVKARR